MADELVITARASSLPTFADCPARWYAQQIEGKHSAPSPRSVLGSAVHASTTLHDQRIIDADPIRPDESAAAAVDYLREHSAEVNWRDADNDLRPREVEAIALSLHGRYCAQIAPTRIYSACEVDLGTLEIETQPGVVVRVTGQGDRIRTEWEPREDGYEYETEIVSDLKTGATAVSADGVVNTKKHAAQTAIYKLLRHKATGIAMSRRTEIIGLQTGVTPASQRVGVGYAEDVEETLLGTDESPGLLHALGFMAKHGVFHGNPSSMLCTERYCPIYHRCHYRK